MPMTFYVDEKAIVRTAPFESDVKELEEAVAPGSKIQPNETLVTSEKEAQVLNPSRLLSQISKPMSIVAALLILGIIVLVRSSELVQATSHPAPSGIWPVKSATVAIDHNLTGVWKADDGATYYVRQVGDVVWWVGLSGDDGSSFTNVFRGLRRANGTVDGVWADVPRGGARQHGTLLLSIRSSNEFRQHEGSGGFGGSRWERVE